MLANSKNVTYHQGDFSIHLRVENIHNGIKVYRALEYNGDRPVMVKHRTPLVSISLDEKNHDFTGSNVSKMLEPGDSYRPQGTKQFRIPGRGQYKIHFLARFQVGEEEVVREESEILQFE